MQNERMKRLAEKSRSIRSFRPDGAPDAQTLRELAEIIRFCPSAGNLQPLRCRIVYTEEECRAVFETLRWAAYLPQGTVPPHGRQGISYIVLLNDTRVAPKTEAFLRDTGIAAQTILLYAADNGLGGCMIGNADTAALKECLHLGERYDVTLVLAIGVPDEAPVIVDAGEDIRYYRRDGVQYVPKRGVRELILSPEDGTD